MTTNSDTDSNTGEEVVLDSDFAIRCEALKQAVLFWHGTNRNISMLNIVEYAVTFEQYLRGELPVGKNGEQSLTEE